MELAIFQRVVRIVGRDTKIIGFYIFFVKSLKTEINSDF